MLLNTDKLKKVEWQSCGYDSSKRLTHFKVGQQIKLEDIYIYMRLKLHNAVCSWMEQANLVNLEWLDNNALNMWKLFQILVKSRPAIHRICMEFIKAVRSRTASIPESLPWVAHSLFWILASSCPLTVNQQQNKTGVNTVSMQARVKVYN